MYYKNICRKDCIYFENGKCKFKYNVQNSIFHIEQKKCIYYASDFKKYKQKNSMQSLM